MRYAIFDSDTASDDAIALLTSAKFFRLIAVTIVAGNVDFDQQVRNAIFTLDYFGYDEIPVYQGARRPIMGKWEYAKEVHGENGMGEIQEVNVKRSASIGFAPDVILEMAERYSGELEIFAVSPLTNIALAYLKDQRLPKKIKKLWIMGGAFSRGNASPIAEYNFWVDPEAASLVLNAGFDITIVPWETCELGATVDDSFWNEISSLKTKASEFFVKVNSKMRNYSKRKGQKGSVQTDTLTVAVAYNPNLILESIRGKVEVETCSMSRGAMLVDYYGLEGKEPNATVVSRIDGQAFREFLLDVLS
ncbi:nucleoside hydrolase [Sulfolobales archaeon HS-7]|nr:nucleoside hydrolase [Sulfolobales archaeon HS-7]